MTDAPTDKPSKDKTLEAIRRVRRHADGVTGIRGKVTCPKCKGFIRYAVSTNNHISGVCETENCLIWTM